MNGLHPPETVGIHELAETMQLKPRTIKYWLEKAKSGDARFKDFPYHQIGSRCAVKFNPGQVLRWYNRHFHIG